MSQNWDRVKSTMLEHQQPLNPRTLRGLVVLPEIGSPPVSGGWREEVTGITQEIRRLVQEAQDAPMSQIWDVMTRNIGPIRDYADQIDALLPKVLPDPDPGPGQPPILVGVNQFGSYTGHGYALDNYPRGRGQNSKGFARTLPIAGRIQKYSFQGPLLKQPGYVFDALALHETAEVELIHRLGTSLNTAVFYPEKPLIGPRSGRQIRAFWVSHVDASIPEGDYQPNKLAWIVSDSGLEFERLGIKAEAAHEHWAVSYSGNLTPNGEGDPSELFEFFGWPSQNVVTVPGPQEYLNRRGWRGLLQAPPA